MQKIVHILFVFLFVLSVNLFLNVSSVIACSCGYTCTSTCPNCDVTCWCPSVCDQCGSYTGGGSIGCGPHQTVVCSNGDDSCIDVQQGTPNRECREPRASCPAGYKKGSLISTTCNSPSYCPPIGNAQDYGDCCGYIGGTRECGDWYCARKNPDGSCNRMARDCVEEPLECVRKTLYTYNCVPVCTAGTAPTSTSPADGSIYSGPSGGASVAFDWNAPSSWGTEASGTDRSYSLCVGTNASDPCNGGTTYTVGTGSNPNSQSTRNVTFGNKYWAVKANNTCGATSALSSVRNICIEGYTLPGDAGVGNAYFSQWSSCNPNTHKRTRTCREDCGTDNCTAAAAAGLLQEDCTGEIRGTIFDATDLAACPSFDPVTGYLIGVDRTLTANNREFEINDQSTVPTHPWAPITAPQTDSSGNYSVRVYAPATYAYDFTNLRDIYVVSDGPKLTCTSAAAVVPGNPTNCGTQPCSIVNNMSFGFERYWGGWWQVQGAGVHGELGLRTNIPSALSTEQSMILPEPTTGNRRGVATYGMQTTNMLGVNTNARVSASLWQALSPYQGVIYDYSYFNQQFKKFATTTWDGVSTLTYDDGGRGYQIVKVAGSVNNFSYSPTGTEKIIFLINGDVTINSNITVPNGAFMAVLSSGSISFGTLVTNADGWYLADHIYIRCIDNDADTECDRNDNQFVGNGSFVAWEGIIMNRDRGGANNILGPAEKFNYRLDLYNNAPEPMKIVTKKYKPYVP